MACLLGRSLVTLIRPRSRHLSYFESTFGYSLISNDNLKNKISASPNVLPRPQTIASNYKVGKNVKELLATAVNWLSLYDNAHTDKEVSMAVRSMLDVILTDENHAKSLTAKDFVTAMFLVKITRYIPGKEPHRRNCPKFLENQILRFSPHLLNVEVGLIASALYRCNVKMETENSRLKSLLFSTLLSMTSPNSITYFNDDESQDYAVGYICKLLRDRGSFNHNLINQLADNCLQGIPESISSHTAIRLFLLMSTGMQLNSPNTKRCVKLFLDHVIDEKRLSQVRVVDLSRFAYGLVRQDHRDPATYEKLMMATDSIDKSDPRTGRNFIFLTLYSLMAGYSREKDLDLIFSTANKYDVDEDDVVLSGSRLQSKLFTEEEECEIHVARNGELIKGALGKIAELDCLLDLYPERCSVRLDPDVREKLLKFHFKTDHYDSHRSKLSYIVQDVLWHMFQSDNLVFDYLLPGSTSKDIAVCFNNGKLDPIPQQFKNQLKNARVTTFPPKESPGQEWYAIVIPRRYHICPNSGFYGPLRFKISQLERVGYNVIVLPLPTDVRGRSLQSIQNYVAGVIDKRLTLIKHCE